VISDALSCHLRLNVVEGTKLNDTLLGSLIHSGLLHLFTNGYNEASALPDSLLEDCRAEEGSGGFVAPMIAPRNAFHGPRMDFFGAITYFSQDRFTPIYKDLAEALRNDYAIMRKAVENLTFYEEVYALPANPGHHASGDSFGGYCYLNWAVIGAELIHERLSIPVGLLEWVNGHGGKITTPFNGFYSHEDVSRRVSLLFIG